MSTKSKFRFDYLPLEQIAISKYNVRHTNIEEGLEELAESIRLIGVKQPVVVLETEAKDKYDLIIGQRRYLASKIAGEETIPALIVSEQSGQEATIASFAENIHRRDLEYRDKMQVTMELLDALSSVENVAKCLGVTPQTIRNYLGYDAVPEPIKKLVDDGRLAASTALRIVRGIPDKDKAIQIAQSIHEMPTAAERKQFIDVARERPEADVENVAKIAKQQKDLLKPVTINLTLRVREALDEACNRYDSTPEEIASDAVEEWLKTRGFIR